MQVRAKGNRVHHPHPIHSRQLHQANKPLERLVRVVLDINANDLGRMCREVVTQCVQRLRCVDPHGIVTRPCVGRCAPLLLGIHPRMRLSLCLRASDAIHPTLRAAPTPRPRPRLGGRIVVHRPIGEAVLRQVANPRPICTLLTRPTRGLCTRSTRQLIATLPVPLCGCTRTLQVFAAKLTQRHNRRHGSKRKGAVRRVHVFYVRRQANAMPDHEGLLAAARDSAMLM